MRFIGKPFSITGSTGRKGFWRFAFFCAIAATTVVVAPFPNRWPVDAVGLALTALLLLAAIRRLHDSGMSGWLVLLPLIPVAGAVALIGLLARPGNSGAGDAPNAAPGVVRGALQGWLEVARLCGAVLDYLVVFIGWIGHGMNGPITQYCRKCHRRL